MVVFQKGVMCLVVFSETLKLAWHAKMGWYVKRILIDLNIINKVARNVPSHIKF